MQDWETTMKRVGQWLLLPAIVLLLVLLGINSVLIASALHRQEYSPPPPEFIPLPLTGGVVWLLWFGPLAVVILLYAPVLLAHFARTHAVQKAQNISESSVRTGTRQRRRRGGALRIVFLLLAILAQLLVIVNAQAFDTSGSLSLDNVVIVSQQEAWATGFFDYNIGGVRSVLWHYQAGQWTQVDGQDVQGGLTALPDGEVWAVGDAGWLVHESQGNWTRVSSGTTDPLNAVAMRNATEGWAVGGANNTPIAAGPGAAGMLGSKLLDVPPSIAPPYTSCRIVHDVAGRWSPVPCPVTNILRSISILPDGSAWAVGDAGTILVERSGSWSQVTSPIHTHLKSVVMVSADEGWAVGTEGTILHYLHGTWQPFQSQTTNELEQVAMASPHEGWIVGERGTLFHYAGGNWQAVNWSSDLTLWSVSLLPGGADGWILGISGSDSQPHIWQKQGTKWQPYNGTH